VSARRNKDGLVVPVGKLCVSGSFCLYYLMSHSYLRDVKPIPTEVPPNTQMIGTTFTSSGTAETEYTISSRSSAHTCVLLLQM